MESDTMPELPEVETVCAGLRPHLKNRIITSVTLRNGNLRLPVTAKALSPFRGQAILDVTRRGKYILMHCQSGGLLWHLGMSGSLRLETRRHPPRKHDHLTLRIGDRYLHFNDPRRFGLVVPATSFTDHPLLAKLGPEPLTRAFSKRTLNRALTGRRIGIKQAIMDSKVVVGVGNIYASEALFDAGLHPLTPANRLSPTQCGRLSKSIKKILGAAIRAGGTTLRDFTDAAGNPGYFQQKLFVYGRHQAPCRRCGTAIDKLTVAGRSTYLCRSCQPSNPYLGE